MKANESNLNKFITMSNVQFVIPIYQRNYDWTIKECKVLLNDIKEAGKLNRDHFIGSIVYVNDNNTVTSVQELIIIDGQQRLTTIILIYLRIYKLAEKLKDDDLKNAICDLYLINKHAKIDDKIKLKINKQETDKKVSCFYFCPCRIYG